MRATNWTRCSAASSRVDFKPMPAIGKGAEELRIRDESGAYRVIYTARLPDAVYVLYAFQTYPAPAPGSLTSR